MLNNKKGFTLIEMLVSVGLLALLGIFIATTYTVISQMSADIFNTRKYLHESVNKFENGEYKKAPVNYTQHSVEVKKISGTSTCTFYEDNENGLIYLGGC